MEDDTNLEANANAIIPDSVEERPRLSTLWEMMSMIEPITISRKAYPVESRDWNRRFYTQCQLKDMAEVYSGLMGSDSITSSVHSGDSKVCGYCIQVHESVSRWWECYVLSLQPTTLNITSLCQRLALLYHTSCNTTASSFSSSSSTVASTASTQEGSLTEGDEKLNMWKFMIHQEVQSFATTEWGEWGVLPVALTGTQLARVCMYLYHYAHTHRLPFIEEWIGVVLDGPWRCFSYPRSEPQSLGMVGVSTTTMFDWNTFCRSLNKKVDDIIEEHFKWSTPHTWYPHRYHPLHVSRVEIFGWNSSPVISTDHLRAFQHYLQCTSIRLFELQDVDRLLRCKELVLSHLEPLFPPVVLHSILYYLFPPPNSFLSYVLFSSPLNDDVTFR